MKTRDQSELVNIGRINSAVGLTGELSITMYSSDSVNMKEGKSLLLIRGREELEVVCNSVKNTNGKIRITLKDYIDRTSVENLKGMEIFIHENDLEKLPAGEHYVRDIIGYSVHDINSDSIIGTLNDVIQNTAQSILDVRSNAGKQILIPAVDAFMRSIKEDNKMIEVELIPGFIDDEN